MGTRSTCWPRSVGARPLRLQLLFYPVTDAAFETGAYHRFAEGYHLFVIMYPELRYFSLTGLKDEWSHPSNPGLREVLMMTLWESLGQLFQRDAQNRDRPIIPLEHVSPAPGDTASLGGGEGYFQLWVVRMFLKNDRDWFKSWYPVVQSLTTFRFGSQSNPVEIAQVAGPGYLHDVDPQHLDRIVQVDLPLTPLVPFTGGTVQIEAGLLAMQASDTLERFLGVMGSFAGLLAVPQLSTVLNVASAVSKGVDELIGISNKQMVLGFQRTLESAGGGGDNDLRPTYVAVIDAPSGTYSPDRLWIKDSKLLYGADPAGAQELAGVNFMLLRIETRRSRDDWDALTAISEPFAKAINALSQVDASGNPDVADAEIYVRAAAAAALGSPDLTVKDRVQVARAIRARYTDYKTALVGERAVAGPLAVPAMLDVGRAAKQQDTSPVTVGELFAEK